MSGERALRQIDPSPRRRGLQEVSILALAAVGLASVAMPWLLDRTPPEATASRPDPATAREALPSLDATPIPPVDAAPVTRSAEAPAATLPAPVALTPRAPSVEVQASPQPYAAAGRAEPEESPLTTSALPDRQPSRGPTPRRRDVPSDDESALPWAFRPRTKPEASTASHSQPIPDRETLRPLLRRRDDALERAPHPRQTAARAPSRGPVRARASDARANWNLPNSLLPIP